MTENWRTEIFKLLISFVHWFQFYFPVTVAGQKKQHFIISKKIPVKLCLALDQMPSTNGITHQFVLK